MRNNKTIAVIIPAINEEQSIGKVISDIPDWVDAVVVGDNGSTDETVKVAKSLGAYVVHESRIGYGSACLKAMAFLTGRKEGLEKIDINPDIVVFLDGDYSDYPDDMDKLVDPITNNSADMVLGSRVLGVREKGALTPQARFGNWLSCFLLRLILKVTYTDLGPFRAIRSDLLFSMGMIDPDYGWTVEMQIKAAQQGFRVMEVPARYRKRIGKSKVSGTLKGVWGAGTKILYTIYKYSKKRKSKHKYKLGIFTRYPTPGKTKTRMIPGLGEKGAADLQKKMTEHTLKRMDKVSDFLPVSIDVLFDGADKRQMENWLGENCDFVPQENGCLGQRMKKVFEKNEGFEKTVLIGIDSPGISFEHLRQAYNELDNSDLVLGPAEDGGYYLIGLKKPVSQLFENIEWGSSLVLKKTLDIAEKDNIPYSLLGELNDVDRPEDLFFWEKVVELNKPPCQKNLLSVIIPTLNEEVLIGETLKKVCSEKDIEVIVVDGGSTDNTVEIAKSKGVKVLEIKGTRGDQMNLGADFSQGEFLFFLHCDTLPPKGFFELIRSALNIQNISAGAFSFSLDEKSLGFKILEYSVNFRSKFFKKPYGDQGCFMKAKTFCEIGGFPSIPLMEDFEMIRKLKTKGKILLLPAKVTTSARRWKKVGLLKNTVKNQCIIFGYYLGLAPQRLSKWYN